MLTLNIQIVDRKLKTSIILIYFIKIIITTLLLTQSPKIQIKTTFIYFIEKRQQELICHIQRVFLLPVSTAWDGFAEAFVDDDVGDGSTGRVEVLLTLEDIDSLDFCCCGLEGWSLLDCLIRRDRLLRTLFGPGLGGAFCKKSGFTGSLKFYLKTLQKSDILPSNFNFALQIFVVNGYTSVVIAKNLA